MSLPILISVPHAGLGVPEEVQGLNLLTAQQIREDGDEGAGEMYAIREDVEQFASSNIARAFVDLNRAESDRRADGVVKTHTCWNVPIYKYALSESVVEGLLDSYYRPYHALLSHPRKAVKLGLDCHTMAAVGPPIGPMAGQERPAVCISNAGVTCSRAWLELMADCLQAELNLSVSVNFPFKGGFIIRAHASELPWLQLELSRAPFLSLSEKRAGLLRALARWCQRVL